MTSLTELLAGCLIRCRCRFIFPSDEQLLAAMILSFAACIVSTADIWPKYSDLTQIWLTKRVVDIECIPKKAFFQVLDF